MVAGGGKGTGQSRSCLQEEEAMVAGFATRARGGGLPPLGGTPRAVPALATQRVAFDASTWAKGETVGKGQGVPSLPKTK